MTSPPAPFLKGIGWGHFGQFPIACSGLYKRIQLTSQLCVEVIH